MLGVSAFLLIVVCCGNFASGQGLPKMQDYRNHNCDRDCLGASPRTCEYDFIIEDYITMSRACYNCSMGTHSDCFRPHCVPGDGRVRPIRTVNRMMPGPGIFVCKDDTVVVNVYNEIHQMEGVTIHWHGILQKGTPYMDGVAMVTQCPIPAFTSFQYKFPVPRSGSYFWHAHTGQLRSDGVVGALIVRETSQTSAMQYYQYDMPEHTIVMQEWVPEMVSSKYVKLNYGQDDDEPDAILLNGNVWSGEINTGSDKNKYIPYATFQVTQGESYRFRLISNGFVNCPFQVSVRNHTLLIVASDGFDIDPIQVNSVTVFAGERFDVVLKADQAVSNYWIDIIGREDCEPKNSTQKAVLNYYGAENDPSDDYGAENDPSDDYGAENDRSDDYDAENDPSDDSAEINQTTVRHANTVSFESDSVSVADMTSQQSPDRVSVSDNVKTYYIKVGFNLIPDPKFYDLDHYPLEYRTPSEYDDHYQHQLAMQINDVTYRSPPSPVLSQYHDVDESHFCNRTSTRDCDNKICACTHRIKLDVDDVVDLVLFAHNGHGIHPMHLHGHSFYVLGMGELDVPVNRLVIEDYDKQGKLVRNLNDPIRKDTVMVPDGGYTIIRFKADNPGWWLFHCHNSIHSQLGMTMVFQVGEPHMMPKIPKGFPKCGNWKHTGFYDDHNPCYSNHGHRVRLNHLGFVLFLLCLVFA